MNASPAAFDFLASNIFKKNTPVNYHFLSRSLGVHQSESKRILYEFFEKNKEKLDASFVTSGTNSRGILIKFSENETDLEEDLKSFEKIHTIHVYCVSLKETQVTVEQISQSELQATSSFSEIMTYVKNGMIKGPPLKEIAKHVPSIVSASSTATSSRPISKAGDGQPTKSSGLTSGYVSRKQNTPTTRASTISGYVSRKGESKVTPAKRPSTDPKPKFEYKSRKVQNLEPKERVIVSNHDTDNNDDVEDIQKKPTAKSSELENLFDDDFSDDDSKIQDQDEPKEPIFVEENRHIDENSPKVEVKSIEEPYGKLNEDEREDEQIKVDHAETNQENKVVTESHASDGGVLFTSYRKKSTPKPDAKRPSPKPISSRDKGATDSSKKSDGKKKTQSSLMNFFQKN